MPWSCIMSVPTFIAFPFVQNYLCWPAAVAYTSWHCSVTLWIHWKWPLLVSFGSPQVNFTVSLFILPTMSLAAFLSLLLLNQRVKVWVYCTTDNECTNPFTWPKWSESQKGCEHEINMWPFRSTMWKVMSAGMWSRRREWHGMNRHKCRHTKYPHIPHL